MKLYSYWRSSASYRVRIALNIKDIKYEQIPVHLVKDGGQQHRDSYKTLNPNQLVPLLVDDTNDSAGETIILNQSLAILEYLEALQPTPPLLPKSIHGKAIVRALCYDIACDAAPMNNLRVVNYLSNKLEVSVDERMSYVFHWLSLAFTALEKRASASLESRGEFLYKNTLTMADTVLIPQIYNARRVNYDMVRHPILNSIWHHCQSLTVFEQAKPENQLDAE